MGGWPERVAWVAKCFSHVKVREMVVYKAWVADASDACCCDIHSSPFGMLSVWFLHFVYVSLEAKQCVAKEPEKVKVSIFLFGLGNHLYQ